MHAAPPLNGRRASSSCLAVAGRLGARSPLTVPAPAALPWLRGGRARTSSLPAGRRPESPHLPHLRARCSGGADLERARGGRRGGACAAARVRRVHARPHVRWPVREVGWLPGQLGRLNSSRTRRLPSELIVRIGVARGRRASPRRRSWPPARAQRLGHISAFLGHLSASHLSATYRPHRPHLGHTSDFGLNRRSTSAEISDLRFSDSSRRGKTLSSGGVPRGTGRR